MESWTEKQQSSLILLKTNFLRLLNWTMLDRAALFSVLGRGWGICVGPVIAFLIVKNFTPEIQGYHYTFLTILAFQYAVDLGFGTVVVQFASHEWSELHLDNNGHILGNPDALSRLVSIANISMKWYLIASLIVTFGLGFGGYLFFQNSTTIAIDWKFPWFVLCILTGINFNLIPVWGLLEGCNQVRNVYTFRFVQSVIVSLFICGAILFGANLWTTSVSFGTSLILSFIFFRKKYWYFLNTLLLGRPSGAHINWRVHMMPMQWRFAISAFTGLFMTSIFTPVMFKYQGAIIAGKMGMTWSLIGILGIASAFIIPKTPQFGMLVAQKKYIELDQLFWKLTKIVFLSTSLLGLAIYISILMLNIYNISIATRLLLPLPTGLFLIAQVIMMSSMPASMYMRAHKKEPIMPLHVFGAVLNLLLVWLFGKYYSAVGMALAYLLVMLIVIPLLFLIWYRCRNKWHRENLAIP